MSMFQDIKNGRFYLGDCLEVMKEIPDGVIDLTVTSPPYDDLRTYNGYSFDFENIAKELYRITSEGGVVVWIVNDATKNGSESGTSFRQALYFMECGFNLADTMIYEAAGTGAKGSNRLYWQGFEFMFVFSKGKHKKFNPIEDVANKKAGCTNTKGRVNKNGEEKDTKRRTTKDFSKRSNIWRYLAGNNGDYKTGHPAVFPEALARDHIISWSNEGDLVFDPFGGSGTTACACIDLNRRWVLCEISEEYANKAVERILNHQREEMPGSTIQIENDVPMPEGEENGN